MYLPRFFSTSSSDERSTTCATVNQQVTEQSASEILTQNWTSRILDCPTAANIAGYPSVHDDVLQVVIIRRLQTTKDEEPKAGVEALSQFGEPGS